MHIALASRTTVSLLALSTATAAQSRVPTSDTDLVKRARAIHERVLTLDTHKDISPLLASANLPESPESRADFRRANDPTVRGTQQVDFIKSREGLYDVAFYIVYVGQGDLNPPAFRRAYAQAIAKFDAIDRMCARYPQHIALARTPAEAREIAAAGRLVACIGIENGYPMGLEIERIREFQQRGARYMGITHNRHNQLGDSHTPADQMLHGGLSDLGRKAVLEMNRVGILVDISHTDKKTMLEAVALSRAPVIASHSGCRAICNHSRNLDDEQLRAVAVNGGVVQCVALGAFVKDRTERSIAERALRKTLGVPERGSREVDGVEIDPAELADRLERYRVALQGLDTEYPPANVADFVDHIDHAIRVIGDDHVGIASDFDGGGGITGWNNASETFNVTLEMVRRGYSEERIAKIWGENTLRIWGQALEVSAAIRRE